MQPVHVAAYIEELQATMSAPTVKQHLACIRMLFDWLVTGQVIPVNSAHSVRGPRHSVSKGSTKVLASAEATDLLKSIAVTKEVNEYGLKVHNPLLVGLLDRALIAVMIYAFARVGAVVALSVEDYYPQNKRWWLRLHEKNGKRNEMPCQMEGFLDAYIEWSGIAADRKGPLFRSAIGKTGKLSSNMSRSDVWQMVRRRAADAGIEDSDRLPHLPRDGDYRLPDQWRAHRSRAAHGRALEREDDGALRPAQRRHQRERSEEGGDLET